MMPRLFWQHLYCHVRIDHGTTYLLVLVLVEMQGCHMVRRFMVHLMAKVCCKNYNIIWEYITKDILL